MITANVKWDKIHVSMRPFWSSDNIMWCVVQGGIWWVARKASGVVSICFPALWYRESDGSDVFSVKVTASTHVSNHNFFLIFNLFSEIDVTQTLLGLEHLNQLLFEHFVNT